MNRDFNCTCNYHINIQIETLIPYLIFIRIFNGFSHKIDVYVLWGMCQVLGVDDTPNILIKVCHNAGENIRPEILFVCGGEMPNINIVHS